MVTDSRKQNYFVQQANNTLDLWALTAIKLYFWPFFVAGIADNVAAVLNPKTYSICK